MKRPGPRLSRPRSRGMALLITLVALVVVESAAMLLALSHTRATALQLDGTRRLRLLALADSAADATLARLALDPDAAGLEPIALGGGTIESTVERLDESHRMVEARARLGDAERRVRLEVRLSLGPPRVTSWRPLPRTPAI